MIVSIHGLFETHQTVAGLKRSMDFYGSALGLELARVFPEPVVLARMQAAAVYFNDPDGHQLEFLSMLAGCPQPELGAVTWSRWPRRHEGVATPI